MDPDLVTYQVLTQSGTALNDLVGSRVDFAQAPSGFDNTEARVVFRPEGGDGEGWNVPVQEASYLFECWGGDKAADGWDGAKAVYAALFDLWHDAHLVTMTGGVLLRGRLEQKGVPVVHPQTKLKYVVARFSGRFKGA